MARLATVVAHYTRRTMFAILLALALGTGAPPSSLALVSLATTGITQHVSGEQHNSPPEPLWRSQGQLDLPL